MKKIFLALIITCLTAFGVWAKDDNVDIYMMPRNAPDISFYDQASKAHKFKDFKGEFVVAVFWSKHCGPCLRELDDLSGFQKAVKGKGIKVILLSTASEWENWAEQTKLLEKREGFGLEPFVDEENRVHHELGITTTPYAVMFNKNAQEIGRIKGSADWDDKKVIDFILQIQHESNEYLTKKPVPIMKIEKIESKEI